MILNMIFNMKFAKMRLAKKGDVNWTVISIILAVFLLLAIIGLVLKGRSSESSSLSLLCPFLPSFC